MISIQSIHHNPRFWPDPQRYDPDRFVSGSGGDSGKTDDDADDPHRPAPYTFVPFIEGPRNCLGQYLALLESKIVLSMLVQRYHMKIVSRLTDGGKVPRHRYMVPVIPDGAVEVLVSRRQ